MWAWRTIERKSDIKARVEARGKGKITETDPCNQSMINQSIVADLIQDTSNKLYTQDMKHGGTPLHWAISREVIVALMDKNCDINILNFDGRTALHIMVLRGRLDCAIALLSRGAKHSIGDNEGNTPLHLAVMQTNIAMVQALIVFGADLEAKNNKGYTPRHAVPAEMSSSNYDKIVYLLHAVGASRCPPTMFGCGQWCVARGEYNGVPPPSVARGVTRDVISQMLSVAAMERAACVDDDQKEGRCRHPSWGDGGTRCSPFSLAEHLVGFCLYYLYPIPSQEADNALVTPLELRVSMVGDDYLLSCGFLLCLDGGGIRGLILVQTLVALEEIVGKPIIQCFDWVAGTSTGGILALALASGKTLRECQRLYFRMKELAFVGMRPYPSEPLETILKDCLGTETVMSDIQNPKLMILAVLADRKPVDLHIFRNYQSAQDILDEYNGVKTRCMAEDTSSRSSLCSLPPPPPPQEQLVWQAARATGAAPSYFRASGRHNRMQRR
ncbi:hypothetical protein EVAR_98540_1 [Eumeta japonica]|uniref:phospholipase A2 n=1 Tax=Eumeta variegata TaxID=151549 RepID=A0A4C1YKU3_EUMVA|nr:hypothetical protein EVAR_98540_1 [Eumeta japonica]